MVSLKIKKTSNKSFEMDVENHATQLFVMQMKVIQMDKSKIVFGEKASSYFPLLDQLISSFNGTKYHFEAVNKFQKIMADNPIEGAYIYWKELLSRAHFAAVASIYRNYRWLEAIMIAHSQNNFFSFAASYRGFVESASDTYDGLNGVPSTLAKYHKQIIPLLKHIPNSAIAFAPEIEDRLIHFSHARKIDNGEDVPDSHKAKSVRQYLKSISDDADLVVECYAYLCQITHPSAWSVLPILSPLDTEGKSYSIKFHNDEALIELFLDKFSEIPEPLFNYAFNPSFLTSDIWKIRPKTGQLA